MSDAQRATDAAETGYADQSTTAMDQHSPESPVSPRSGRQRSLSSPTIPTLFDPSDPHGTPSPPGDTLITPRPGAWQAANAALSGFTTTTGYFPPHPIPSHSSTQAAAANDGQDATHALPASPSLSAVSVKAEVVSPATPLAVSARVNEEYVPRPPLAPGDTTITSLARAAGKSPPQRSQTEYPVYPNQSFAALHNQTTQWRSGSHSAAGRLAIDAVTSSAQPASLFTAKLPQHAQDSDSPRSASPFSSPYLHPVQPHIPKETHRAEKDVDTISGRKRINQYEMLSDLGHGVHGKVKMARNLESGETVAIKIVQRYPKRTHRLGKPSAPEDQVKKEVAILKKADHQNIVRMLEVIDDPAYTKVYIVLEFCELAEVDWRALGDSHIVYLEERRFERLTRGLGDTIISSASEVKMLKSAQRREHQRKKKWKQRRREDGNGDFWSLEFAEESDGDTSDLVSRTSSARGLDASLRGTSLEDLPEHASLSIPPAIPDEDTAPLDTADPADGQSDAAEASNEWDYVRQHSSASLPSQQSENVASSVEAVLDQVSRGRQPSISDSVISHMTDVVEEEVPEDHRYVPVMTIPDIRSAIRDAILGLEYLHYQGIIHRDIKPANLLRMKDRRVKISDFGVSYLGKPIREGGDSGEASEVEDQDLDEETELARTVGTPAFYAPELCSLDVEGQPAVTSQIDVWALGVTLYCLLFARTPFTADNTFALMRSISVDAVAIPRQRLMAVDTNRPSSKLTGAPMPIYQPPVGKRLPNEYRHEDIDEDLYDLLKRLLIKNPMERITLREVKHHPWVLADILHKADWIEETDPSRHTQNKKIEISREEVADAIIPLKIVDRVKSFAKRTVGAIPGLRSRRNDGVAPGAESPVSSGHTGVGDPRRHSLRIEDSSLLRPASRGRYLDASNPASSASSPGVHTTSHNFLRLSPEVSSPPLGARPGMPDRSRSDMSTAASIKTIRQEDVDRGRGSPPSASHFPSSDLHRHTSLKLGSMLSGASKNLIRTVRSRERHASSTSSPGTPSASAHTHGDPIVGLDETNVAAVLAKGYLTSPATSARASPRSSPSISTHTSAEHLHPTIPLSQHNQQSSPGTPAAPPTSTRTQPTSLGGGVSRDVPVYSPRDNPPTDDEVFRARETMQRRRLLDGDRSSGSANSSRPASAGLCPPSPDDETFGKQMASKAMSHLKTHDLPPTMQSANRVPGRSEIRSMSSASSDDFLPSGTSQATSFPSMGSMLSADTSASVAPEHYPTGAPKEDSANSSDTSHPRSRHSPVPSKSESSLLISEDEGYVGDNNAFGSDESDSDDDFLVMNRKAKPSTRVGHSAAQSVESLDVRKKPAISKSMRSGSSNTVKVPGDSSSADPA